MKQVTVDSKAKFIEWSCKDYDNILDDRVQRAMFLALLNNYPNGILEIIKQDISTQIRQYKRETSGVDFEPDLNEQSQLCNEVLEALAKHFLPEKQAEKK